MFTFLLPLFLIFTASVHYLLELRSTICFVLFCFVLFLFTNNITTRRGKLHFAQITRHFGLPKYRIVRRNCILCSIYEICTKCCPLCVVYPLCIEQRIPSLYCSIYFYSVLNKYNFHCLLYSFDLTRCYSSKGEEEAMMVEKIFTYYPKSVSDLILATRFLPLLEA